MYTRIIRPIFFHLPPEAVHQVVAVLLRLIFSIPGIPLLFRRIFEINHPLLEREVFGLKFPNPVGIAAGFDKEARLYNILGCFGFGHVEIGTVTPLGQPGNPKPRLFRLPADQALINRMGFNNHGLESVVQRLKKEKPKIIIGGNIGKNTLTPNELALADYCRCFEELFDFVDYFVVNVSCPNIANLSKLQDKDELTALLNAIQSINLAKPSSKPVLLKISPDLTDDQLDEALEIVNQTGLNGIIATNTSTRREKLSTGQDIVKAAGQGGLSGKPLKSKALRAVSYLHQKSEGKVPIIAVGGIFTPEDALDMLRSGASLVQVYTGFVYQGPSIARSINKGILHFTRNNR